MIGNGLSPKQAIREGRTQEWRGGEMQQPRMPEVAIDTNMTILWPNL